MELMGISVYFNKIQTEQKRRIKNAGPLGRSDDLVVNNFKTLTRSQIKKLIEIYRWDFEAFEYDYKSFENLGIDI